MPEDTILYVKPGCPYSQAAREDLKKRGVPFAEVDVTADPSGLATMLKRNGGRREVPTIVTGERVEVGFGGG